MELDVTVRPVQISEKQANALRGLARMIERKNFLKGAEVIDDIVRQYDGAQHLTVVDSRSLALLDARRQLEAPHVGPQRRGFLDWLLRRES